MRRTVRLSLRAESGQLQVTAAEVLNSLVEHDVGPEVGSGDGVGVQKVLEVIRLAEKQSPSLVDAQSLVKAIVDDGSLRCFRGVATLVREESFLGVEHGLLRRGVNGRVRREGGDSKVVDHLASELVKCESPSVGSVVCEREEASAWSEKRAEPSQRE